MIGDAKESLQALIPLLTRKSDRSHLEKYQKAMAKWRSDMDDLESPKPSPIAPQHPVGVLDELATDDAIVTCDSGTIEQMVLGYPEHGVRFPQPAADYAAWATACGGYGAKVAGPAQVEAAIRDALAFDGPAIVDIDVDPNEPPLPGKVAYDQAKKFAQAFLKGQPHKAAIATTLFKDKIEQLGR